MNEKLDKAIKNAKACYMSNAKWRKLFEALDDADIGYTVSYWGFMDSGYELRELGFPSRADLLESRLVDGRYQPIEYRSIKYIRIPKLIEHPNADPKRPLPELSQDLSTIANALNQAGQFPLYQDDNALFIRAYET